jgi:hypothetical protein
MVLSDEEIAQAEAVMQAEMQAGPRAVSARYDRRRQRLVVSLDNGLELAFPPRLAEGLDTAKPEELSIIEITPTGLGLYWPKLDADLYLPALMSGVFGSPTWMAGLMGRKGGRARTDAKILAARANGQRGGRPRKAAGRQI